MSLLWVRDPAHQDTKAIRYFALPGVKKRRLFEDILDRSSCALDRQGKISADCPGLDLLPTGGGIIPFSIIVERRLGHTGSAPWWLEII